jgi:hypothetical protein
MPKKIYAYYADIWPLLLFLLLPVLCFPELLNGQTLFRNDLTLIHYPLRHLAAEQWLLGQVPLWNPYAFMGFPFLAEGQVGILYPLNMVFWLPVPTHQALHLFIFAHFFLAATFTYILARSLGLSRPAATLSGLSFGFGGFFMGQLTNLNIMSGSAWLPLIFAAFLYTLKTRRWPVAMVSGLALALQSLTSQPQIILYTLLFLGGYAVFCTIWLWVEHLKNRTGPAPGATILKSWALLVVMVGSGLILASAQLLPSWELTTLSLRSGGLPVDQMGQYSLPPLAWLNLLLPGLFGNMARPYEGISSNMSESYVYVGILPLVFAFFSWRARRRPMVLFLWLVVLICGVLALGRHTPLLLWLQHIPIINLFRGFGRWSLFVMLTLALLAGWGAEALLKQPARKPVCWLLAGGWLGLTTLLLLLALFPTWFVSLSQWLPPAFGLKAAWTLLVKTSLLGPADYFSDRLILGPLSWWLIPTVALVTRLGGVVLLLLVYAYRYISGRTFAAVFLSLTILDMILSGGTAINPITPVDHWQQRSAALEYILTSHRPATDRTLYMGRESPEEAVAGGGAYFAAVYHLLGTEGYGTPIRLSRFDTFRDTLKTDPLKALSLTATRFVISPEPFTDSPFLEPAYQDDDWYVYENPYALPRTFIVHQAQTAAGPAEALALLEQPQFDLRQPVIESTAPLPPLPSAPPDPAGQATILRDRGGRVEIQAELPAPGLLVLVDTYYPDWYAYVDGQPAAIWPANYLARAVYLEAGQHTVEFIYRPASFWTGLFLGLAGLVTIITLSVAGEWGSDRLHRLGNYFRR